METREACKILHQALAGRGLHFSSSLGYHSRSGVELSLWSAEGEGLAPVRPLWFETEIWSLTLMLEPLGSTEDTQSGV